MEVTPSYKQSEVGVIPKEWQVTPITSVLQKGTRITYGVVKPGRNDENGVLFIRGGDIFSGNILINQLRTISQAISAQYKRTRLNGGEIVISLVGYPGEVALVPPWLAGANIARQVALLRLDSTLPISGDFICKFLQSDVGRRLLLKESIGSAQQVINLRDINRVVLLLPTKDEQCAIAKVLGDVDALLGGLDRLIAKKRDLKQAATQQLLTGQTRLPASMVSGRMCDLEICSSSRMV
jgi:type I restriction enzyme, S subunit